MSDFNLSAALQQKINLKTKPLGALGQLEELAYQLGFIQESLSPVVTAPHIMVFAGDHGIAATGLVNPYPQAVTAQMVYNFVHGGAAINVFTRLHQIGLTVVDAGVVSPFDEQLPIVHAKVGNGTKNYLIEKAMTTDEVAQCLYRGKVLVARQAAQGTNTIGFGEMGIGNTSSAALLMHHFTQIPLEDCVGKGTGTNEDQYTQKLQTLQQVVEKHRADIVTTNEALATYGGYEIAMMVGAYLGAMEQGMTIVVDGFIATAALLVAAKIDQRVCAHCIFAHTSGEKGHAALLAHLGAKPLLNLGMRLGEGTGAALAIPLLQAACAFMEQMASFEAAGVDQAS